MAEYLQATVLVPVDRVAEFYEMVGRWLMVDGPDVSTEREVEEPQRALGVDRKGAWLAGSLAERVRDATQLYSKASTNARRILDFWMDHPSQKNTGEEIAEAVGLNSKDEVNGSLSSIGSQGKKVGRPHPFKYQEQPGGQGIFWMEPEMADLFRQARANCRG